MSTGDVLIHLDLTYQNSSSNLHLVLNLIAPYLTLKADGEHVIVVNTINSQLLEALSSDFASDVFEGALRIAKMRDSQEISIFDVTLYLRNHYFSSLLVEKAYDIDISQCFNSISMRCNCLVVTNQFKARLSRCHFISNTEPFL